MMKIDTHWLTGWFGDAAEVSTVAPAPLLMPLEPRIVYDASVASLAGAAHHGHESYMNATARISEVRASEPSAAARISETHASSPVQERMATPPASAAQQVVFIDPNVADYQSLIAGLPAGTAYVVLNQTSDGLAQIAQYLELHPGISSIHLVSHGSEAQVQVGGTLLDLSDLSQYSGELAEIGAAMKPGGDFLIYGCDVAEGSDGQALVQQIAALTDLNVAASTTQIGAASLGGDWTLNYDVGNVTTPVIFSAASEQQYGYVLSQTIEDYTTNPTFDSGSVASFSLDGITYTITKTGGNGDNRIFQDPTLQGLPDENSSDNSLLFDAGGTGGTTAIKITMTNGDAFNMSSLDIDVTANANVTFTTNTGATATPLVSNGNTTSTTISFGSSFNEITSLTIGGGNLAVNLGHLVYTEVGPPTVTTSGGTTNYVGDASATTVDSGVTVTDSSETDQASGTVSIGSGFHSGDTLAFTNTSATLFGNISSAYNSSTGVLTLTSSGITATNAQWTNAFEAVTFASTSSSYGDRTISFVVSDGTQSSTAATKTLDVTNPDPVVTTDSGSAAFSAGDNTTSTPVTVDSGVTLTDGNDSTITQASVQITGNLHSSEDVLAFVNTSGTLFGNISESAYNSSNGTLTLLSSGNSATLAQWQHALEAITYTDTAVTPNTATRTVSFTVTDSDSNSSATATRTVTVADTDQTPIVTTTGGTDSYVGGTSATTVDSGVTVSDLDNTTQSSGTVSVGSGFHSGDILAFTNSSATLFGNIGASYNSGTGVLTLTSSGATATDAQWANAFDAVTFSSSSTTYGNRTISFVVNDGTENSTAATKTVDMTSPPTVTTDSGSAAFTAGDNTTSTPVVIDSGLTVTDPNSTTLASATVSITGNFHTGEDVLAFTNNNSTMGNIVGAYNATTGVMTLTGAGSTLAQWQAALESVTYTDSAVTPNSATRTISFVINDGTNSSATATRTVTVADTDQTPIVTTTGGTDSYIGGTSATTVDSGVTVSDLDNITQSSGTVSVGSGFHSGDTLAFTNSSATLFGNIGASYNSGTGVLTLTSSGATATDAQWANAFDAVTFSSSSTTYGNRTISFVVNDGTENSVAATKTVDVTNPDPAVMTDSGSAAFTAGDNTTSTPVAIDSGLTVTDPNSTTLASATVSITGNFHTGEDVLAFTNNNSTMGNIVGAYNATTGVMTLTGAGSTLAQWQAALESVTYTDSAVTPNNATRTISFVINDGTNSSATATRTVTVADTDQTPIVTTTGGTDSYIGGTSATTVDSGVTVSDLDNTTQSSGTVSVGSGFHSGDTLAFTNSSVTLFGNIGASYNAGTGVLTLTSSGATATDAQWANAFDAVTFSSSSTTYGNRTISFVVNDGTENSTAATKTVDVTNPDPAVMTDSGSAAFTAGDNTTSTPVAIDSGLTVTDPNSTTLASATVSITGNFHTGEDVLAFTNNNSTMGNIVGAYNATTGVMTLTGAGSTLAQWQAALESVTYTDSAVTPNNATRTISFVINDGTNSSATATRTVTVADTDQTPIVTTTGSTTNYVGGTSATTVDSGVTVSDLDNTTQSSGTVSVGSGFHSGDILAFTNSSATLFGNIGASYNSGTGVLTLTSSGATATDAQWANAFDAVTFSSSSTTYGNRTISFVVNDGTENSVAATKTVDVTSPVVVTAPIVTTSGGVTSFIAGDNTTSTPVTIDSGITVSDNTSLVSATVAITGNFHAGEDVLTFTNNNLTMGNIAGSYNATTGVMTLTGTGSTLAQWQAALDSVLYTDTAVTPNNTTRTISFSVNDGTQSSALASKTVTVQDTDQVPVISGGGGSVTFTSTGATPAVAVDPVLTLTDRASTTPVSATISIVGGFEPGVDTLGFISSAATGTITGSYNSSTGVLTLSASGATLAQWQAALNAVTYAESGGNVTAGTRTLSFSVSDGETTSAPMTASVVVAVQNPPPAQPSAAPPPLSDASSPDAYVESSDSVSNPNIVLSAFDPPTPLGGTPVTHTTTFSSENNGAPGTTVVTIQPTPTQSFSPTGQASFAPPPSVERVNVTVDQPFSIALQNATPGGIGNSTDVVVRQLDGHALPSWVHFDAATGTLSGTAPANGPQVLRLVVVERDSAGHVTRHEVVLNLGTNRAAPVARPTTVPHPRTGSITPPGTAVEAHAAHTAAKTSLTEQFARLRRELHVA